MGSNTEKKPWTNLQNSFKNLSKEIKSVNFCYRKVGRVITKWGAIEKSPILLSQYWKQYYFKRVTKIISHFDGSNNIFADCSDLITTILTNAYKHVNFSGCFSSRAYSIFRGSEIFSSGAESWISYITKERPILASGLLYAQWEIFSSGAETNNFKFHLGHI